MTSRLEGCAIDCADPATLARFWAAALGYQVLDEREDLVEIGPSTGSDEEYLAAFRSGPTAPGLIFVRVPEPKSGKNRLHFDISPIDDDQAGEVSRLQALGAVATDLAPANSSWVVMTDHEGNEFCVVRSLAPDHFTL